MHILNGHRELSHVGAAVIGVVANGTSEMEAAARLHLYDDTVRRHLRSATRRWAATDRQHLPSLWRAIRQETPATVTAEPKR